MRLKAGKYGIAYWTTSVVTPYCALLVNCIPRTLVWIPQTLKDDPFEKIPICYPIKQWKDFT